MSEESREDRLQTAGGETLTGAAFSDTASKPVTEQTPPLWKEEYSLTKEEITHCLDRTETHRIGKGRLIAESVLLGAVGIYAFAAYWMDENKNEASLLIGICCVFVLLMLLVVPRMQTRLLAAREARQKKTVTLRGYDGCIGFGRGDRFSTMELSEFTALYFDDMLILQFRAGRLVGVPRRAVADGTWDWLTERLSFVKPPQKPKRK